MRFDKSSDKSGAQKPVSSQEKPAFPLSKHKSGRWYKWVQNRFYYFGKIADDPNGDRALAEWLQRKPGILNGTDNMRAAGRTGRVESTHSNADEGTQTGGIVLSELAAGFLQAKRSDMLAGELSKVTYGDYIRIVDPFVAYVGNGAVVDVLQPKHFAAYAQHLKDSGQGRYSRKRTIASIKALFKWGEENRLHPRMMFGTGFKAPKCSLAERRKEYAKGNTANGKRLRNPDRIVTGAEIKALVRNATPLFKAIVLLGVNCGLGPADIGRIRWRNVNMKTG